MTFLKLPKGESVRRRRIWTGMEEAEPQYLAPLVRALEGRQVSIALTDGSRIDDCQLISAGRTDVPTLWLYDNGADRFVALSEVCDIWEAGLVRPTHAA